MNLIEYHINTELIRTDALHLQRLHKVNNLETKMRYKTDRESVPWPS